MMLNIEQLERWLLFGASWEIVAVDDEQVVVDFCSCTGELIERGRSGDRDVIDYVQRTAQLSRDSQQRNPL
jgi:hypothetical protein